MAVLIDTSFLVALADPRDQNHTLAVVAHQLLREERRLPAPVLPEAFYMVTVRVGYAAAIAVFRQIISNLELLP